MRTYRVPSLTEVKARSAYNLFTFFSTFAGGGGSSTGYRMAGGKCLGINEFIPAAQDAYRMNYPDTPIIPGDIRKVTGQQIMDIAKIQPGELDIFDGSPPCKSFSMAGKRDKGWGKESKYSDSAQRTDDLFYEYARVAKELQSKVIVAENVKGIVIGKAKNLLGSSQNSMFDYESTVDEDKTIFDALSDAGYNIRFKVLNAAHYGTPTARERAIFIGTRKDLRVEPSYPKRFDYQVSVREALDGIEVPFDKELYVKNKGTKTEALWNATAVGDGFDKASKELYKKAGWFSMVKVDPDKPLPTLVTTPQLYRWDECRTFSLNELKAMSSFPPDYYVGDTYARGYERIGRAVPPFLMKAVAEHIYNTILQFI